MNSSEDQEHDANLNQPEADSSSNPAYDPSVEQFLSPDESLTGQTENKPANKLNKQSQSLSDIDIDPETDFNLPDDFQPVRPVTPRRRRQRSLIIRPNADEIDERLEMIARRSTPTLDFFVAAMAAGALLSIGYIVDAPAILLMGILASPIISPWIGAMLSTAVGERRFFGETMGGFFTALIMVFIIGLLGGLASRIFMPLTFNQAFLHARLWYPDLILTALGTSIITIALIQSEDKPILASLMLAYSFFLPVSVAGFGLGNGVSGLFPEGLFVFLVHLAISSILAIAIFFFMGFRPYTTTGYLMGGITIVISLAILSGFAGFGNLMNNRPVTAVIVATPTNESGETNQTEVAASLLATATTQASPTLFLSTPTPEFTPTPLIEPTPVYGRIDSDGGGTVIRKTPGGTAITTIENGYLVEILPDPPQTVDGTVWVHVLVQTTSRDIDGWIQLSLIATATPAP